MRRSPGVAPGRGTAVAEGTALGMGTGVAGGSAVGIRSGRSEARDGVGSGPRRGSAPGVTGTSGAYVRRPGRVGVGRALGLAAGSALGGG